MLSVCVLYSMMVLGGRLRTRRRVSLMRAVVAWSLAVLFQIEIMSSWKKRKWKERSECILIRRLHAVSVSACVFLDLPGNVLRPQPHRSPLRPWTAPPAWPGSGSPNTGTQGLSLNEWSTFHPSYWHHPEHAHYFKAGSTLLSFNNLYGKQADVLTSHMGLMPSLKRWKSLWPVKSPGRIMWL